MPIPHVERFVYREITKAMPAIVVLTGGGIKGAVAAARSASDNEIILLHVHYGQRCASAEAEAARALGAALLSARVVTADMPHVVQISQATARSSNVSRAATARRVGRRPSIRSRFMRSSRISPASRSRCRPRPTRRRG